jgi:lipoprotein-anchoring transpeptidase ErfK/SrfK
MDNGYALPPVPPRLLEEPNRRVLVYYTGDEKPGTIEVDRYAKFLYWVMDDGTAWRYPIAVGRLGRSINGDTVINRKVEWPGWTPTANMLRTEPEIYGDFAGGIPGGLRSPLGARALYLYRGGRDTYYRIHGTNDMESIGNSGSAGCIRMFNHDIIHLFEMVPNGTRVVMRSEADSERIEEEYFNRGEELPARRVDPDAIYGEEALMADRPLSEILADQLAEKPTEPETDASEM